MPDFCYYEDMDKEIIRYSNIQGIALAEENIPSSFPSHWHNAAEFVVVLKNGCRYRIGDTVYSPSAGDLLLIWPRELHEIVSNPENGVFFLQFASGLIENSADLSAASRFLKECHLISCKENPELVGQARELIDQLRDTYRKKQYFSETRCKLVIYNLLLLLGDHILLQHREHLGDEHFSDKSWAYIRSACSYISEHACENISQSEVASHTGLSPYYFSKLFHKYTQTTFPAYLSGIRVQKAINLLTDEDLSITECAFSAGFQSTTAFNKVFLEHTGLSPRQFRKLHRLNG